MSKRPSVGQASLLGEDAFPRTDHSVAAEESWSRRFRAGEIDRAGGCWKGVPGSPQKHQKSFCNEGFVKNRNDCAEQGKRDTATPLQSIERSRCRLSPFVGATFLLSPCPVPQLPPEWQFSAFLTLGVAVEALLDRARNFGDCGQPVHRHSLLLFPGASMCQRL